MGMINYYLLALSKYFKFQGRSRRSEYWYFFLVSLILGSISSILDMQLGLDDENGNGPINATISLIHLIPSISAGVRRMHDINRSGWWILVPFYSLYLMAQDGDLERNRFGLNPKGPQDDVADTFN